MLCFKVAQTIINKVWLCKTKLSDVTTRLWLYTHLPNTLGSAAGFRAGGVVLSVICDEIA